MGWPLLYEDFVYTVNNIFYLEIFSSLRMSCSKFVEAAVALARTEAAKEAVAGVCGSAPAACKFWLDLISS